MDHGPQVGLGRRITLGFCIAVVGLSVLTVCLWLAVRGTEGIVPRLIRLALIISLMSGVYVGSVTARWVSIVLFYIGGTIGLVFGVLILIGLNPVGLLSVVHSLVYIVFATCMLTPGPMREYLRVRTLVRRGWQPPLAPPSE